MTPEERKARIEQLMNSIVAGGGIVPLSGADPTLTTTNNNTDTMARFKIGDKIKISATQREYEGSNYFAGAGIYHGANGSASSGHVGIERDDGVTGGAKNGWWLFATEDLEYCELAVPKAAAKAKKIDFAALQDVIMAEEMRQNIIAVLSQKQHHATIFEEWGLGEKIEYGRGMGLMFHGGPGTGKTWAAHCIARALGCELLVIGAAEIQTSEPGGANRNIQQAFKAAKDGNKVLMFDECDSLITIRSDVGMVLASEINTLLTEIEKFEGVLILATNRIETMDPALERRISLICEFPEPTFTMRQKIWEKILPIKLPLSGDVNAEKLAEWKLTGGQIKNVLLNAARLAAAAALKEVALSHFAAAVTSLQASSSLMGTDSRWSQGRPRQDFSKGPASAPHTFDGDTASQA